MFDYSNVVSFAEYCDFGVALAYVIAAHYKKYTHPCPCMREAMRKRSMRLMFVANEEALYY